MAEGYAERDVFTDRIITKAMIRDLYRRNSHIRVIRSGVFGTLAHCADVIRELCTEQAEPKQFRIILPRLDNPDIDVRSKTAGRDPEDVRRRLTDWQEIFAKTALEIPKKHSLELRVTPYPHRYHALFSDSEGIAGIAFHTKASLTTTSLDIHQHSAWRKWLLGNLIEDFDAYWDMCDPYHLGDNKKLVPKQGRKTLMDEFVQLFGRARSKTVDVLRYVKHSFPDANGNGVTKELLKALIDEDASDCNKRLLEMEKAGLLYKLSSFGGREFYGRLITKFGELILREWDL